MFAEQVSPQTAQAEGRGLAGSLGSAGERPPYFLPLQEAAKTEQGLS